MKPIPYFGNYSLFTIHYNLRRQGKKNGIAMDNKE